MALVDKKVKDFNLTAFKAGEEDFFQVSRKDIEGKWSFFFFYPADFTFVCPSELIALNNKMREFKTRNVEVIGISVDSHFSHNAWRNTPIKKGGIGPVRRLSSNHKNSRLSRSPIPSGIGPEIPSSSNPFSLARS